MLSNAEVKMIVEARGLDQSHDPGRAGQCTGSRADDDAISLAHDRRQHKWGDSDRLPRQSERKWWHAHLELVSA